MLCWIFDSISQNDLLRALSSFKFSQWTRRLRCPFHLNARTTQFTRIQRVSSPILQQLRVIRVYSELAGSGYASKVQVVLRYPLLLRLITHVALALPVGIMAPFHHQSVVPHSEPYVTRGRVPRVAGRIRSRSHTAAVSLYSSSSIHRSATWDTAMSDAVQLKR